MIPDVIWIAIKMAGTAALWDFAWYFLAAGSVWLAFYILFTQRFRFRKIIPRVPSGQQLGAEIARSVRSTLIFGLVTGFVVVAMYKGYTQIYGNIDEYGWGWFFASIALAVVIHDAYFYWTHRLMHHRRLFRHVHRPHHLSNNPTPWAAYSFGVVEAFVQAGIAPLLVVLMPMHPAAFALFMVWQLTWNVLGHCGYEIWPRWLLDTPIGRIVNTPTHHTLHHEAYRGNYSLYFTFWDRVMGTTHPDYDRRLAQVTAHADFGRESSKSVLTPSQPAK
jgi:Delta7-sterol 5-desaturase